MGGAAGPAASEAAAPEPPAPEDSRTVMALIPFWGGGEEIITQFGDVLYQTLEKGGAYRPDAIDMTNLPEDVPEGGFPPYVCPSPSLTKETPYAITGEITREESGGLYHLRLYLWEMANNRLLYSDEIVVQDKEECERFLPPTLEWLFSWLPDSSGNTAEQPPAEPLVVSPQAVEEYRLYLGLKLGSSIRFYYRPADAIFVENDVSHFFNIITGIQASYYFFPFLGVQAEALFTNDYAPYKSYNIQQTATTGSLSTNNSPFTAYSLMFPLSLKLTLRKPSFFASALVGGYFILPLGEMRNTALSGETFAYTVDPPLGYNVGIDLGTKLGPGNLFLDIRWAQDLGMTQTDSGTTVFRRSMVSIALGYELGFFPRNN